MKILILLTGGTIGCSIRSGIASPDPAAAGALLDSCICDAPAQSIDPVFYDTQIPYYILSETLDAHHMNLLSGILTENLHKDYDGILITHGSDSLCYAAALLDLMFADSPVPIVMVCSNYPLSDPRANGRANFEAALAFLRQCPDAQGVYAAYRNEGPDTCICTLPGSNAADTDENTFSEPVVCIHKGAYLLRHAEASGDLTSLNGRPFARYHHGEILKNPAFDPDAFGIQALPAGRTELLASSGILQISCAPAACYPADLKNIKSVILLPYHSGTLPVNDPAFIRFCTSCRAAAIPVYVPTGGSETIYESVQAYASLGIRTAAQSAVCLFAWLWIEASRQKSISDFAEAK